MKALPNIDKSKFRAGGYVGYGRGRVFKIAKVGKAWRAEAVPMEGKGFLGMTAPTLTKISEMLARED